MAECTFRPTLTATELTAAAERAGSRILELYAASSPVPIEKLGTEERHNMRSLPHKAKVAVSNFIRRQADKDAIPTKDFFDFLQQLVADHRTTADGKKHYRWSDEVRDYMIVKEQLLNALDLKKEFIEYNRSQKSKESRAL